MNNASVQQNEHARLIAIFEKAIRKINAKEVEDLSEETQTFLNKARQELLEKAHVVDNNRAVAAERIAKLEQLLEPVYEQFLKKKPKITR